MLAAAALFSTGGAAIKACSLDVWQVASFRSGVAALALWVALPESRRGWRPRYLLVGVAYAATMILYVGGNKLTTAANTIFLQSTAPMYLLLLGPWLLAERVRRADLLFSLALLAGLVMFFAGAERPQLTAPDPFRGNVVAAFSGLSWALTILGLRWLGREKSSPVGAAAASVVAGNLIACLVALPFALPVRVVGSIDLAVVLYLGVLQIGLAYVFLTRGVGRLPALEVSLLLLLEPVLNTLLAWIVHGEHPGPASAVGCAIILLATSAFVLGRHR